MSANISKSVKAPGKPGRTVAILFVALLAFSALAFFQNDKVKLGLDLRGGTSVTLTPKAGEQVTAAAINTAVSIIRERVNSLGVSESTVSAQGTGANQQIVISVPGITGQAVVNEVGQTAELRFRQVLASGAGNATTSDRYRNLLHG